MITCIFLKYQETVGNNGKDGICKKLLDMLLIIPYNYLMSNYRECCVMKGYYTVQQISDMLDIHPKTIQRYIREGKLRASKVGKGWRITGHDLSTFVESNGDDGSCSGIRPIVHAVAIYRE
jgi:excisionase family DNA binding protein